MDTENFTVETAVEAATALDKILAGRMHRKKVLGQEVLVPGQLGQALHLPLILRRLNSKQLRQREQGFEDFSALWHTLSAATRHKVLAAIDWYDPKRLDWDDKRSNRRPVLDAGD